MTETTIPPMLLLFPGISKGETVSIESHERGGVDVPDCLEGDHAASDPVWTDLHDVNLACDPARSATRIEDRFGCAQCLLEDADTCAIAKLRESLL